MAIQALSKRRKKEKIGSPMPVKWPQLLSVKAWGGSGSQDGTSAGLPAWSGGLDGNGSQELHAKSWLCHRLGLSVTLEEMVPPPGFFCKGRKSCKEKKFSEKYIMF